MYVGFVHEKDEENGDATFFESFTAFEDPSKIKYFLWDGLIPHIKYNQIIKTDGVSRVWIEDIDSEDLSIDIDADAENPLLSRVSELENAFDALMEDLL